MKTIEEGLQQIQVQQVEDDRFYIHNWFAVSTNDGIIAYFGNETDACRFRLDYINRILNP